MLRARANEYRRAEHRSIRRNSTGDLCRQKRVTRQNAIDDKNAPATNCRHDTIHKPNGEGNFRLLSPKTLTATEVTTPRTG